MIKEYDTSHLIMAKETVLMSITATLNSHSGEKFLCVKEEKAKPDTPTRNNFIFIERDIEIKHILHHLKLFWTISLYFLDNFVSILLNHMSCPRETKLVMLLAAFVYGAQL